MPTLRPTVSQRSHVIQTREGVGGNMRGEKMAVCPHGAQHDTLITSLYPPFHPPIPDAQNSQPNAEDHFLSLRFSHFRFPLSVYVLILFLLPVFFTLFPSLLSCLLIDPLSVTLFLSHSLCASQHGIYKDKCDPKDTWHLFSSQSQSATM